jgi:hypothetical protein
MGRTETTMRAATVLIAALLLAACAGKTTVKSNLHIKGAPSWVNKGTNTLNDKKGRLFHGVGIAPDIGDISLQKDTADNRGGVARDQQCHKDQSLRHQDHRALARQEK